MRGRTSRVCSSARKAGPKLIADKESFRDLALCRAAKIFDFEFSSHPTARTVDLPFLKKSLPWAAENESWCSMTWPMATVAIECYRAAPSILQVKAPKDVAVEMFTMSKPYSMAGWRIGFWPGMPE